MDEQNLEKLKKPYNPKDTEDRIYKTWEESGFFNPDICIEKGITAPDAETFSMVLPPPNVTGTLHLGHSFEHTMQDIVVRFERMRGKRTLWIPGTDHAAIATQSKVEKILAKEGKRKTDLGRTEFLKQVDEFAQNSHDSIVAQCKQLGTSLDWSREAFTLDEARGLSVRTAFKKMFDEGLIYRGHKVINWDPKGQTVISDDEIVYEERKAKLYTFKYSKDFPISISTTRPETKVGDTAVAVHPEDPRYIEFIGKIYEVEFCGVPLSIKIVADDSVEKEFGTGALGVTPAHSSIDADIAMRHMLPTKQVINEYAKMMVGDERLIGKKTTEAREVIVEWLRSEGLLEKEEEIDQNVSTAERSGGIIEPLPKLQWFINVNKQIPSRGNKTLKELMLEPIKSGAIKVMPDRFEGVYLNWINNLRDWCISRQIWYGHQIPVWYKKKIGDERLEIGGNTEEIYCGINKPEEKTNFVFLHGFYRTREVLDPLAWLYSQVPGENNFWEILPHYDNPGKEAEQIQYIIDNAEINENTVIVGHSRGSKLAMRLLEQTGKKIQGLILIAAGIGSRKIEVPDAGNLENFDYDKVRSLVKNKIVLIEATEDHVRHPQAFKDLAEKLDAHHIKAEHSQSHYNQEEAPEILAELNKYLWTQDEDTLDTWFSSGLWTFSTLGWPNETTDFKNYHPTSLVMPGYEIIFFWVARMILMSQYLLGEIPFKTVYFHGIVRDSKGKKFSKSADNGVDPIDMINKYGADALRMSMVVGVAPGNDLKFDEQSVKAYGKFANKIWNITRFVLEKTDGNTPRPERLHENDEKYLAELDAFLKEINKEMEEYKFYIVSEKLYHFIWHNFADNIIEEAKVRIMEGNEEAKASALFTIYYLLFTLLPALHPFMPFITEEIWNISGKETLLMAEKYPWEA